jgi:hypothetical protein
LRRLRHETRRPPPAAAKDRIAAGEKDGAVTADRAAIAYFRHELRTPLNHIIGHVNTINIDSSNISHGTGNGVVASGSNAIVRFSRTIVAGNATSFAAVNGGQVQSYGDNNIDDNANNFAPPATPHQ